MLITKKGIQMLGYLLIWVKDDKVKYQRFRNLNEMIDVANQKEEVIAHTQILSVKDMINSRFIGDKNAETLEDKLRDEHRPIPKEKEDASLFETMAEKFRPKQEENWDKDDDKGPIRYNTFKEMTNKFTEKMEDIHGPDAHDPYYEDE